VLDDGSTLLVDRGWIALGPSRTALPGVHVDERAREIQGRYDELPRAGLKLETPKHDAQARWPRIMNFPEREVIERALERELLPGLMVLDPTQPDGYERNWQQLRATYSPDRHLGYAVQWFGLATTVLIVFVIVSFRKEAAP
jgi:surfeit locus 1 family protein